MSMIKCKVLAGVERWLCVGGKNSRLSVSLLWCVDRNISAVLDDMFQEIKLMCLCL